MSTANTHPGLSYGGGGGLRRGPFAPTHPNPPNKPSPNLSQHASPYQPQAYAPQQPNPGSYPHHIFSNSTPPLPQVTSVAGVQNGARSSQPPPTLPGPRQRAPAPRQMQPQPSQTMNYLQQSLNQTPMNTQPLNPQQLSQQSIPPQTIGQQSMGQQSLGQQSLGQQSLNQHQQPLTAQQLSHQSLAQQTLNQTLGQQPLGQQPLGQQTLNQQSLGQQAVNGQQLNQPSLGQQHSINQHLNQQPSQQSIGPPPIGQPQMSQQQQMGQPQQQQPQLGQQSLGSTTLHQPLPLSQPPVSQPHTQQSINQTIPSIENAILSHRSTPNPPSQPSLPPNHSQKSQTQVQKAQQAQQVQPIQQQAQQHATPPQPEPSHPVQQKNNHHNDDIDMGSQDESGEGDTSLDPKGLDNSFVPRTPMGPPMSAPPEGGSYSTLEEVHKSVLAYCTSVGYAIVIGRSKKTVPGLKKVLFVCDRAGKPPRRVSPEMRKRKTSSRKCDCQFGFFAIEQRHQWTVRYRPDAQHLKHNHGPSESPLLHPAARKLDSDMVARVKQLKESGVGVTQTLEILQTDHPHVPLLPRDIYNARAAINRNPTKIATDLAENRPAIYSKPLPSAEERIRADLRRELAKAREDYDKLKEDSTKEVEDLKKKIQEKDAIIAKFEMFIDICNQRVMLQRDRLSDGTEIPGGLPSTTSS